jgi:HlyD family secretion protein
LDRNYINHNQEKIQFKVGQTAQAEIITRRRRIAEVIFEPLQKLREGGLNL